MAFQNDLDLDHPDAIDTDLFVKVSPEVQWHQQSPRSLTGLLQCLRDLKQGKATEVSQNLCVSSHVLPFLIMYCLIKIPVYSFKDHRQ